MRDIWRRFELTSTLRITYEVGVEHTISNPFGRTRLVVRGNCQARVDQWGGYHGRGAWEGRVRAPALIDLLDAIAHAGELPPIGVSRNVPEAAIELEDGGARTSYVMSWHAAQQLAGHRESLMILDSLNHQLSDGAVSRTNQLGRMVYDTKRIV